MLRHEVYLLRIWRSRAVSGWQWAAQLQHLPDGQTVRFSAPKVLLAHLQALVWAGDHSGPSPDPPAEADGPVTTTEDGGTPEDRQ